MTTPQDTVNRVRLMWSAGYMRKAICAETGLAPKIVSNICRDLEQPIQHRGRKKSARALFHVEDDIEDMPQW